MSVHFYKIFLLTDIEMDFLKGSCSTSRNFEVEHQDLFDHASINDDFGNKIKIYF